MGLDDSWANLRKRSIKTNPTKKEKKKRVSGKKAQGGGGPAFDIRDDA